MNLKATLIIIVLLSALLFASCQKQIVQIKTVPPTECERFVENTLKTSSGSFNGSKEEGIRWCRNCLQSKGAVEFSYDAGPICKTLTKDAGKSCTDSSQCEGICISSTDSMTGSCSGTLEPPAGCYYVLRDEKSIKTCFE